MSGHTQMSGHTRTESQVSGHTRTESQMSGHTRTESQVSGHMRTESQVSGHTRTDSQVSGHMCTESQMSGHTRTEIQQILGRGGHRVDDVHHRPTATNRWPSWSRDTTNRWSWWGLVLFYNFQGCVDETEQSVQIRDRLNAKLRQLSVPHGCAHVAQ